MASLNQNSLFLYFIFQILFSQTRSQCYTTEQTRKKFKQASNAEKFLKTKCAKKSLEEIKQFFGYKIKTVRSTNEPEVFIYMTMQGNRSRMTVYSDLQNIALAHEINAELCLKSRLFDNDGEEDFLLMEDCFRYNSKLWVVHEYFPEFRRLSVLAPMIFTQAYELQKLEGRLDQMERLVFGVTKAMLNLHKQNMSWGVFDLENIIFYHDGSVKITGFGYCKIDDIIESTPQVPETLSHKFNSQGTSFQQDIFNLGVLYFKILSGPRGSKFLHFLTREIDSDIDLLQDQTNLPFPKNFFWAYDLLKKIQERPDINGVVKRLAFGFSIPITNLYDEDVRTEVQNENSQNIAFEDQNFTLLMTGQREELRDGSFFQQNVPRGRSAVDLKELALDNPVQEMGKVRADIEKKLSQRRFHIEKMSFNNPVNGGLNDYYYMKTLLKIPIK